ncbi:MAG: branched-chain amino acid ABC transporter permease [Betaproteobacteria bacterium]|jgi:branched-chain amino acid transport system permease protein
MDFITFIDLLLNALAAGAMLGGFYAAVSIGISISFGMLDIANIAHPAMIMLGSFLAYTLNDHFGLDPLISMVLMAPFFGLAGIAIYRVYYRLFESRERDPRRGLAFFFGLLFVTDVALILIFGVDLRGVQTPYVDAMINIGFVGIAWRLLIPFLIGLFMVWGIHLFLTRTFFGLAVSALSQEPLGLRLIGADPISIKQLVFGLSVATAAWGGAALIIIQPVEPSLGREYIGRVFAVCVLGGMGSMSGTFFAALLLGVVESLTSTFIGPSWSPAVAFGLLLLTLALRPTGLMGRAMR